uniref:RNA-directed RNA polymerase L n=1 Tax=Mopeia virus TaxID=3052320 RepID=Q27YE7_MOPEI|nr:L protein [Mammarenavirus mopeiaense]
MEELLSESKDLISKYLLEDKRLSKQKLAFLIQTEPRMLLMEGLKLLSLCIEIDSCKANGCDHNTEDLSVEILLQRQGVLCPGLPFVVPDGFKFNGNTLILLECFVRTSPVNFEQKYKEDMIKLESLKSDLLSIDVILLPLVDGRTNFYTDLFPEWANERFRNILFSLLEYSQQSSKMFEESEYSRLCESLTKAGVRTLGVENLNILTDSRSDHYEKLLESCYRGINNKMSILDVKKEVITEFQAFRNKLREGEVEKQFVKTDREQLLKDFSSLYFDREGDEPIELDTLKRRFVSSSPIVTSLYGDYSSYRQRVAKEHFHSCVPGWKSLLNKIKSLKLLNTRRKLMLTFDAVILLGHLEDLHCYGSLLESEWLGSSFLSVNDRLVSLQETQKELKKWIDRRLANALGRNKQSSHLDPNFMFFEVISHLFTKAKEVLSSVNLCFKDYVIKEDILKQVSFKELLSMEREGVQPTMSYEKMEGREFPYPLKDPNPDSSEDLERLSSISLALVNSMKTSSVAKIRQNEHGAARYKRVRCKEAFNQSFVMDNDVFNLIYQKTGECSKCYAINNSERGEVCSFYADPKRFFPAIFSHDVILRTIETMMSWITECVELSHHLRDLKLLLKIVMILILSNPSKRAQKFLQGLRYFIMAFVSDFHHKQLMEKLREDLITESEYLLYSVVRNILTTVLSKNVSTMLTNRFKFILNLSYMCHFITKETPDRLTDQIKCFEKYLEPKLDFNSINVNPSEEGEEEEKELLLESANKFLSKETSLVNSKISYKVPGVSRKFFSMMTSSFNNGSLFKRGDCLGGFKDPLVTAGCATALDLASNKSVVVNKYTDGERVLNYDHDKLVAASVCQLSETFQRKTKYLLSKEDYDYKVQRTISDLVIGKENKSEGTHPRENFDDLDETLLDHNVLECLEEVKESVDAVLSNYKYAYGSSKESGQGQKSLVDLRKVLSGCQHGGTYYRLIQVEITHHMIEDFDESMLPESVYEEICKGFFEDAELRQKYFYLESLESCPITCITQAVSTRTYHDQQFFQCFKSLLLQMNAGKLVGKYSHYKNRHLNFKIDREKLMDDVRISERESNSEALGKALSLTNCTTAVLKNLCFYSQESPQSYTSLGPDTGRLKFSLSYKEQVGGNRELYIGDLRTKMFTRLVEDYFEALTRQYRGSCLNDEKEFHNAILAMKLNVSLGQVSYSLDHSKWGPMMSPYLFLVFLQNLRWDSGDDIEDIKSKDYISTLLSWHVHKLIEVPFNVVNAMMKSYLKSRLGLKKSLHQTTAETFFFEHFKQNTIPSHLSSIIDMGQGILHNTSDFYGLVSERFINYCIECLFEDEVDSYTSSDDQISLFGRSISNLLSEDPEEFQNILEFHYFLSDRLNKFISPKSVARTFVAEFKSRFFVWGDEVPLLTKFVAAALHNVKCKEPHQLAETIDTIIDQSVANGVPVSLCNVIQERTLNLLRYAQYPIDPFLLFLDSDVKDWVDGNRGYRIMRNIEAILPESTLKVRKVLRIVFNKLKLGELHEEFTAIYLSGDPVDSFKKLTALIDDESLSDEDLSVCWLNLTTHHPLKMVMRQKVVYAGALELADEKLPTLVKTLQNKLSSSFTRGAQKLLCEAVNKSAFQSGIASGFIGLCKTLGSKCVRFSDKSTTYIKSLVSRLSTSDSVTHLKIKGIDLWGLKSRESKEGIISFLRPVLWDYFCIALSTSLELGPWVLGEPKVKEKNKICSIKFKPCDYFPMKPSATRLLEDKVGFNHIIHSFRRLYPSLFEKHLLPFMSDLASTKMKWTPKVKFLDLCVVLDVNCEAMSLISHVVKWKREEHYVVLSSELTVAHERSHLPITDERVVTTYDVVQNFLRQVYFESFVRPFVATTRTLGSFTWFPHRTSIPESEGLEGLGPFSSFVEKVIYRGIERPMYKHDLHSGYAWLDFDCSPAVLNLGQLIASGMTEQRIFTTMGEMLESLAGLDTGSVQMSITVNFQVKSQGESLKEKFFIHLLFKGVMLEGGLFKPHSLDATYSGNIHRSAIRDCWRVARTSAWFKTGCKSSWFLSTENIYDYLRSGSSIPSVTSLPVWLHEEILDLEEFDFIHVGPEDTQIPLVVDSGFLMEGKNRLIPFNPRILDQDMSVFIGELSETHRELLEESLGRMLKSRLDQKLQWLELDLVRVTEQCFPEDHENFLFKVLSRIDAWIDFKGYSLCYSKSLSCIMIQSTEGNLRLKGKLCKPLFEERRPPLDID